MAFVRQSLLVARPVVRRQGVSLILKQAQFSTAGGITVEQKSHQLFNVLDPAQIAPKHRYPLAGLNFLPSSHSPNFPKFLAGPLENFPRALQVVNADQFDAAYLAQHCRSVLDKELPKYSVVLFRGLPFNGDQFVTFTSSLGYPSMGYDGGSGSKPTFKENAFVIIPSDDERINMEAHNEMAYWHKYPRKVFFYCLKAPKEGCGGLTPVISNSEVIAKLDPKVVQKCRQKNIRYIRTLHHEKSSPIDTSFSWQTVLQTKIRKDAEEILKQFNLSFEWNKTDGSLRWWYNLSPFITHPETGKEVFFNQVDAHHSSYLKNTPYLQHVTLDDHQCPTHTTYGDGEEIEPEVLDHIRATKWACAVAFQWKEGDLLVIDNFAAMHGRLSFTGERKLLAYLSPI